MISSISIALFFSSFKDCHMAILHCRTQTPWATYSRTKVHSHIHLAEVPDEDDWTVNDMADKLATVAREKVLLDDMIAHAPSIFPGMGAVAKVEGELCTTRLKDEIHFHLTGPDIKEYLCQKHSWSNSTFATIHWEAHEAAIRRFSQLQRITVTKFIHGWLATKQHRYRTGRLHSPLCQFCNTLEDKYHIFRCTEVHLAQL